MPSIWNATRTVEIYSNGIIHCSVCAPKTMPIQEVEAEVNRINPSGIQTHWRMSKDTHFSCGETHPCTCGDNSAKQHWLMEC